MLNIAWVRNLTIWIRRKIQSVQSELRSAWGCFFYCFFNSQVKNSTSISFNSPLCFCAPFFFSNTVVLATAHLVETFIHGDVHYQCTTILLTWWDIFFACIFCLHVDAGLPQFSLQCHASLLLLPSLDLLLMMAYNCSTMLATVEWAQSILLSNTLKCSGHLSFQTCCYTAEIGCLVFGVERHGLIQKRSREICNCCIQWIFGTQRK